MARIPITLTDDQRAALESIVRYADEATARQWAHIIVLLHSGYTPTHLANGLDISRKTVYNVAHSFELHGIDGLFDRSRSGRPNKADNHYRDLLEDALAHAPEDYDYVDLGWTTRFIQEHMARETGVTLSLSRLKDLLHELGYAYQRQPPRVDGMLPPMPRSLQEVSGWLGQRNSLKGTLPEWMFRPYTSWVKVKPD